jgi:hypothetical protein
MVLAGAAALVNTRAARLGFPFSFCGRTLRRPSPPCRVERRVAFAARTCPRARACACHGARTSVPQHACVATVRARPGLGPFFSSPAVATEPPCSPRRRHARDGRVAKGSTPCRWLPRTPCRAPGRGRTSQSRAPRSPPPLASSRAPPWRRHVAPSRSQARTPARSGLTRQRTPAHAVCPFAPPRLTRVEPTLPCRRRAHACGVAHDAHRPP